MAFGGEMQADQEDVHPWLLTALDALRRCLDENVPTLGVCLGGQMLARAAGGPVGPAPHPECSWGPVELTDAGLADPLFAGLPRVFEVYQWHSYEFGLPPEAVSLASSDVCLQSFRAGPSAWGLQWHPEVTGGSILRWAQEHRPAPGGVPVPIDMEALEAQVAQRIEATNEDGRRLCARGSSRPPRSDEQQARPLELRGQLKQDRLLRCHQLHPDRQPFRCLGERQRESPRNPETLAHRRPTPWSRSRPRRTRACSRAAGSDAPAAAGRR